jgi:hypothetical protein
MEDLGSHQGYKGTLAMLPYLEVFGGESWVDLGMVTKASTSIR